MTHCSFCGKSQARVRGLVASSVTPTSCICDECLCVCRRILEADNKRVGKTGTYRVSSVPPATSLACGFCSRSQEIVDKLIGAPAGHEPCYICDRCVGESITKLADKQLAKKESILRRLLRIFPIDSGRQNFNAAAEELFPGL